MLSLSGVGSIFFRDEEELLANAEDAISYDEIIMPYKGQLEVWFMQNKNLSFILF